MYKPDGDDKFYFIVGGTQCCNPSLGYWGTSVATDDLIVPIGEWFEFTTYYKVGNNETGRVVLIIKKENEENITIFDEIVPTSHPDDEELVPLKYWSPHKLYVGPNYVDYVRFFGGALQLYFDDWEVYLNGFPEKKDVGDDDDDDNEEDDDDDDGGNKTVIVVVAVTVSSLVILSVILIVVIGLIICRVKSKRSGKKDIETKLIDSDDKSKE